MYRLCCLRLAVSSTTLRCGRGEAVSKGVLSTVCIRSPMRPVHTMNVPRLPASIDGVLIDEESVVEPQDGQQR